MKKLKDLENEGYQFDGADSSFELLIRKNTGAYRPFFELIHYQIISSRPTDPSASASAVVKVRVGEKLQLMAAEGNGPVNALDQALRAALEVFYPALSKVRLIDYKVRVMDGKKRHRRQGAGSHLLHRRQTGVDHCGSFKRRGGGQLDRPGRFHRI